MTDLGARLRTGPLALVLLAAVPSGLQAQFDDIPVPAEMDRLSFMRGDWRVEGVFRLPDLVGDDRRAWYRTRGGGVTGFDGRAWTAHPPGEPVADSVLARIDGPSEPFRFQNDLTVRPAQEGFALFADEGRTAGSTTFYFDPEGGHWVALSLHAPTAAVTRSTAPASGDGIVFTGRGTDRRGERIFVRTWEQVDQDHIRIRTDVSFDGGETWIDDQIIQDIERR